MKTLLHHILPCLGVCIGTAQLHAIDIVNSGATGAQVNLNGTYTQNFDTLLASTPSSGVPWVNDVTIPGWYSSQSSYSANGISGALASYGTGSDRAIGSIGAYWALRFVNNSSQTITGFTISYTGEQWFRAANDPQASSRMTFRYRIYEPETMLAEELFGIGSSSSTTPVEELYFTSPEYSATSAIFLDGNSDANSDVVSFFVDGISLAPGEKLWLRWFSGSSILPNSHALAIDDLTVNFLTASIPEPASAAFLCSLGALAFVKTRRRPRNSI